MVCWSVLYYETFGLNRIIDCLEGWRETQVMFDHSLNFIFLDELQFQDLL